MQFFIEIEGSRVDKRVYLFVISERRSNLLKLMNSARKQKKLLKIYAVFSEIEGRRVGKDQNPLNIQSFYAFIWFFTNFGRKNHKINSVFMKIIKIIENMQIFMKLKNKDF